MISISPALHPAAAAHPLHQPDDAQEAIAVLDREPGKTAPPPLHRVILLNDDYTPMDFVVDVLRTYFNKNEAQATELMLTVHTQGRASCGIYPKDTATTKVSQVMTAAREADHPLQCIHEPHI
jgi:ATP-dependent Clp protease adaptor protein ClpS